MSAGRVLDALTAQKLLFLILIASLVLRMILVRNGGQYYWPDEVGYEQVQDIVEAIARGDTNVVVTTLDSAGALLFKIVALVPATIEFFRGDDSYVPGLFFAVFSVANIWLIGRIARALGAGELEALLASALLALSASFLYFARHLLPYDMAMTLALTATYAGLRSDSYIRGSFLCGVLAGCTFFTYHGYVTMAAAAQVVNVCAARSWREAIWRALFSASGLSFVIGLTIGVDALLGGRLLQTLPAYAGAVTQGDFDEGWRLPFEYLWHAEHGLLALWLGSLAFCLASMRQSLTPAPSGVEGKRVRIWLIGLAFVFITLAVSSSVLHVFVVYGRLARQLVPFFCLIAAYALDRIWASPNGRVRAIAGAAVALVAVQAAVNFARPLTQTYPDNLERQFGPSHTSSLIWLNVEHIFPEPRRVALPDRYTVVFSAPHPLEYLPYQYEGYTLAQRRRLRETDIRMRLLAKTP